MENEEKDNVTNNENTENKLRNLVKDKKNIAIIILLFLLIVVSASSADNTQYENQIANLTNEKTELSEKLQNSQIYINTLQTENSKLKEEKENLETEKQELNSKVEELEKKSNTDTVSSSISNTTSSQTSSSTSSNESTSTTTSAATNSNTTNSDTNSEMVWVGETGTKYHKESCRTLKGNGHQITMQQALSEGRQACKVCY
jgi:chromosome segregation ATPase